MPLYEYRCTQCGHQFEKIQSFSSTPETECPKCNGKLDRPLTAPVFKFKGAGWYVNDYASKSAGSSSGESGSSDAKPAPAADAKPAEAKPAADKPATPPASSTASA